MIESVRCLVKKYKGDFERAAKLGYGINLSCAEGYMWLVLPYPLVNKTAMEELLKFHEFTQVSEVEYR